MNDETPKSLFVVYLSLTCLACILLGFFLGKQFGADSITFDLKGGGQIEAENLLAVCRVSLSEERWRTSRWYAENKELRNRLYKEIHNGPQCDSRAALPGEPGEVGQHDGSPRPVRGR